MRTGFLMSVIGHTALLLCALISPTRLQTAHGDAVAVELVSPADFAQAAKNEPASAAQPAPQARPEATPQWQQADAKPMLPSPPEPKHEPAAAAPAPAAAQRPPAQTQPAPPLSSAQAPPVPAPTPSANVNEMPPNPNRLAAMLGLSFTGSTEGFGSEAESGAKLSRSEIAAFKAHLRSCWTLPPGIAETQKVKIIVRVALKPDGALATTPTLIEASASALGPPLVQSAMRALKACAPFTMLPAAKYQEWKVLDLNFSPDVMAGG